MEFNDALAKPNSLRAMAPGNSIPILCVLHHRCPFFSTPGACLYFYMIKTNVLCQDGVLPVCLDGTAGCESRYFKGEMDLGCPWSKLTLVTELGSRLGPGTSL